MDKLFLNLFAILLAASPAIAEDYQCKESGGCTARMPNNGTLVESKFRKNDIVSTDDGWVVNPDDGWKKVRSKPYAEEKELVLVQMNQTSQMNHTINSAIMPAALHPQTCLCKLQATNKSTRLAVKRSSSFHLTNRQRVLWYRHGHTRQVPLR